LLGCCISRSAPQKPNRSPAAVSPRPQVLRLRSGSTLPTLLTSELRCTIFPNETTGEPRPTKTSPAPVARLRSRPTIPPTQASGGRGVSPRPDSNHPQRDPSPMVASHADDPLHQTYCWSGWTGAEMVGVGSRVLVLANSSNPRSASLTALVFGNASAISGSSTTMLEASLSRAAYLPRTIGPKSSRRYSGRKSSFSKSVFFFIELSLCARRKAGADDTDALAPFRMRNDQQSPRAGNAESDLTHFSNGMIRVITRERQLVFQRRRCFFEGYLVRADCGRLCSDPTQIAF
jgi:hypothetical protein